VVFKNCRREVRLFSFPFITHCSSVVEARHAGVSGREMIHYLG
jgi:hypothetical protein